MAIKKVLLKNTELEACLKIVAKNAVGTTEEIEITPQELCFKPTADSYAFSSAAENQFQQVGTNITPSIKIIHGQWSGLNGNCNCRIYRGSKDFDHLIMTICVGDTTQLEFDSQSYCAEYEWPHETLIFEIDGEMTLWFKLRKHGFESFAGEYASYGAFEDDNRRGPYERYETLKS